VAATLLSYSPSEIRHRSKVYEFGLSRSLVFRNRAPNDDLRSPMSHLHPIPAAQYVRMSTDEQQYSIHNQKSSIAEYARLNGFQIVRTYEDPGESGLGLKNREGLRQLLADVIGGTADYKKIIVLDVSRWGRFQDADESAHYEFVCRRAGFGVIYCAEQFNSEGTLSDYLAKVLKRTAAAEFSRELSIKSFENHVRVARLGFRVGSEPGYGFRRMCVGSDGQSKGILRTGQHKPLMTDRVTLVHGPGKEVQCVKMIFRMRLKRMSSLSIARELNRRGVRHSRKLWKAWMVDDIVSNSKYAGRYVWNKTTQRLHCRTKRVRREEWIVKNNAFPAIVSETIFDKAQRATTKGNRWSDQELLSKLQQLLSRKGSLSEWLIRTSSGMPSVATYYRRLGTFERIYKLVGFVPPADRFDRSSSSQHTECLRAGLFRQIQALFPGKAQTFHLAGQQRLILRLDNREISILLCRSEHRPQRAMSWSLVPVRLESQYATLLCRLNSTNDGFHSFHLFRQIDKKKAIKFTENYPWLRGGRQVKSLEELCKIARILDDWSPQASISAFDSNSIEAH
jgi:DNA invertase Pin-like site-specific DNA recombinase